MISSYLQKRRGYEEIRTSSSNTDAEFAAALEDTRQSRPPQRLSRTHVLVVLACGGLLLLSMSAPMRSSGSSAAVASSTRSNDMMGFLWGGSHDKHERHHPHPHSHDHDHGIGHTVASTQAVAGLQLPGYPSPWVQLEYERDLMKVDWQEVAEDIVKVMKKSQDDYWPADYGTYGGLFIRLSWHSCGSYRRSDGRGGCDGGGQRFDPERSWPDNTNLDKARQLLLPVKMKHGNGVSWGDLFALAGTVAIKEMGGPVLGFCAGRIDMIDNSQTLPLGPTREQEKFAQCPVNGQCPHPLGQDTLGLIYVNPQGPMGEPDLQGAANHIRDVFGRMDWTGRELVALIGGGHTFGKAHGASTSSPGDPPESCPFAPWRGPKGADAVTSGMEGPWTSEPTNWDNKYFQYLVDFEWEPHQGPGGAWQWRVKGDNGPKAPSANPHSNATQDVMMLTTDVALSIDPEYRQYVQEFADNEPFFAAEFAKAWYKLVTRDMGPVERCVGGSIVPSAEAFQFPLPHPPKKLANMEKVAKDLHKLMDKKPDGEFIRLAYQCAGTFRATDYLGGCNGGRIRFPPGSEWKSNEGLKDTLALLEPIKNEYGEGLSWADLIVLAGNVGAERAGSPKLDFCPGRTDDKDGSAWHHVEYGNDELPTSVDEMIELYERRGQTAHEFVALTFPLFGSSKKLGKTLEEDNAGHVLKEGLQYFPELRYWADYYVSAGTDAFGRDFAAAWTRLMNADRFDGPVQNACSGRGKSISPRK